MTAALRRERLARWSLEYLEHPAYPGQIGSIVARMNGRRTNLAAKELQSACWRKLE